MEIFDNNHYEVNSDFEIYNYLRLMSDGLGTDYWVAPVLDYYNKFKTSSFCKFLKALDRKVSADWICALSPTMRIENVNAVLQEIESRKGFFPPTLWPRPHLLCSTFLDCKSNFYLSLKKPLEA